MSFVSWLFSDEKINFSPKPPLTRPKAPPPPPPPHRSSELDSLKQRVSELEKKVRDLDWVKKATEAGE